jgi:hypothetical protein
MGRLCPSTKSGAAVAKCQFSVDHGAIQRRCRKNVLAMPPSRVGTERIRPVCGAAVELIRLTVIPIVNASEWPV